MSDGAGEVGDEHRRHTSDVSDDDLDALVAAVDDVRERLVVIDFDGTLSPIVAHPGDAVLAVDAASALAALGAVTDVVVLSGRPVDDLAPRLEGVTLTLVGGHGAEVRLRGGERIALLDPGLVASTLDAVVAGLDDGLDPAAGWQIERKPVSVAVHRRRVAADEARTRLPRLRALLDAHLDEPPGFERLEGDAVTELRPRGVDKGTAIAWLAARNPGRIPLVVGDDVTDEDAFRTARGMGGDAVLVAEQARESAATWRLTSPARVVSLLSRLADAAPSG